MPYKEKSSLDLRACLTRSNEKGMPICKILDLLSHYVTCLDSKIPLRKRSFLEQYSTDIRVVTANYIHAVTVIFLLECLNTWQLQIWRAGCILYKGVLNNFEKIHRKTSVWESLFKKSFRLQLFEKDTPTQVLPCDICEMFVNTLENL